MNYNYSHHFESFGTSSITNNHLKTSKSYYNNNKSRASAITGSRFTVFNARKKIPKRESTIPKYMLVQDSEIKNVYTNVIKKGHINNPFTSRTNNNINLLNNLYFCNSRNNDIKCDCCKDHICKVGNCMCVSCMRKNVQNFGLREGDLINKSGRIAKIDKGDFYCGCQFEEVYTNVMGKEFRNIKQCKYYSQCNDCKILKKFMKEYLPESVYKRITRKKNNN